MFPNFLVAGSMKCGTSALFRGIKGHPDVFGAPGKELHYFDRHYDKGPDWYQRQFDGAGTALAVGEGTPYLGDEPAMTRMVTDLPDARFILILRQPVDRAYSHYWHNRRREREERTFEDAFQTDLASEEAIGPWMNYWRLGNFSRHVGRLAADLDRSQIMVLLDEDLRRHREKTLAKAWEFIGVDPKRGDTEIRDRPLHRRILRGTKNLIKGRSDDRSYPPIDRTLRRQLTEVYRDDIAALADMIDRDLAHWLPK